MLIRFFIGANPYALDETSAIWLEETIRQRFSDHTGRPYDGDELDRSGTECLLLADVIADDLCGRHSPEPIELGDTHIRALNKLLDDAPTDKDHPLARLAEGCRRYTRP